MIEYDAEQEEIRVIETITWGMVKDCVKDVQSWVRWQMSSGIYDEDTQMSMDRLASWLENGDDEQTVSFGSRLDLMMEIADNLKNEEDNDFFSAVNVMHNAVCDWLATEFGVDIDAGEIEWTY